LACIRIDSGSQFAFYLPSAVVDRDGLVAVGRDKSGANTDATVEALRVLFQIVTVGAVVAGRGITHRATHVCAAGWPSVHSSVSVIGRP